MGPPNFQNVFSTMSGIFILIKAYHVVVKMMTINRSDLHQKTGNDMVVINFCHSCDLLKGTGEERRPEYILKKAPLVMVIRVQRKH